MKTTKYTGAFKSDSGDTYTLSVNCTGFVQAYFLLTAEAIKNGKYFQLETIEALDLKATKIKVKQLNINNFFEL